MFEPYLWSPVGIVWVTLTAAVDAYRVLYTRVWIYCTPHGAQMCCDAMWSIVCELLWLVLHRSHNAPIHTRHPVGRIRSNTCEPHAPHSYCATWRSGHDDVCAHPHYNNMFESQCTSTRPNCYCRAKRNACVCVIMCALFVWWWWLAVLRSAESRRYLVKRLCKSSGHAWAQYVVKMWCI